MSSVKWTLIAWESVKWRHSNSWANGPINYLHLLWPSFSFERANGINLMLTFTKRLEGVYRAVLSAATESPRLSECLDHKATSLWIITNSFVISFQWIKNDTSCSSLLELQRWSGISPHYTKPTILLFLFAFSVIWGFTTGQRWENGYSP